MNLLRMTVSATLAMALGLPGWAAQAAWTADSATAGDVTATSVSRAESPSATRVGSSVRLDWAAVTLAEGTPATGYTVTRYTGQSTGTEVCSTAAPTVTCTDAAPVLGVAYYTVRARFKPWTGPESPQTQFTFDDTAPTTTMTTSPAPNAGGWNNTPVSITLEATDASSGVASISYQVGAQPPVTVSNSSTSFTISTQGSTPVSYYATDIAGNVSVPKSHTVRIDTLPPSAPTLTSISNDPGAIDQITNVPAQTITGTAEPGSSVTLSRGATTFPAVLTAADGTFAAAVTLVEGSNTFTATATDTADNSSPPAAPFTATLDTLSPTLTVTDPRNGVAYRNNTGPVTGRWSATCSVTPGACGTSGDTGSGVTTVTYQLRDTTTNTCWAGSGTTYTAATCGTSLTAAGTTTWSEAIAYGTVQGRTLQLTVTATDRATNTTSQTVNFSAQ